MATTYGFIFTQPELEERVEIRVALETATSHGAHIKFIHPNAKKLADSVVLVPTDNGGSPITVGEIRERIRKQDLHDKHFHDIDEVS